MATCSRMYLPLDSHLRTFLQVTQDGKYELHHGSWLGGSDGASRSRMIVDNLLGRSAPPPDNAPADLPSFREALLLGWQRLEATIERNSDNEQLTVVHLHWASTAAVCACKSPIPILSTLTLTTVVHGCPVCRPPSGLRPPVSQADPRRPRFMIRGGRRVRRDAIDTP
jgi:hypothetical protein